MALFRPSAEKTRQKMLRTVPAGPVADYLNVPFPAPETELTILPLLAIDLETTGLDPETDHILSIGFIPVDGLTIPTGKGQEIIVRQEAEVGQSATFHGITDDEIAAAGVPLSEALAATLQALQGRALLAHHADIEVGFIKAACRREFGAEPTFVVVDTLKLAMDWLMSGDEDVPPKRLRLSALRGQFGLPRYLAHNALIDALACGELYLALTAELGQRRLREIWSR